MPGGKRKQATDPVVKDKTKHPGEGQWWWVGTKKNGYAIRVERGKVVMTWETKLMGKDWKKVKSKLKKKGKSLRRIPVDEPPF